MSTIDLSGLAAGLRPGMTVSATIQRPDGTAATIGLLCRVETEREAAWVRHGGILPYVTRALLAGHAHGENRTSELV